MQVLVQNRSGYDVFQILFKFVFYCFDNKVWEDVT